MIPNTKISQTILEFGEEILAELPTDCPKVELEAAFRIILTVWNAVTLDSWNGNRDNEIALFRAFEDMPKRIQLKIKRLVARKKRYFGDDLRGVGNHWIREGNGELIFGCDARLNSSNLPGKK